MERLTFDGNFCEIAQCRELPCQHGGSCSQRKVWERLKEYEDTGLTPEVCAKYKTFEDECIGKGVTFNRIVELMNAAADVVPVRRGRWIEEDGCQICSECGEEHEWDEYRAAYCDVCGAKMEVDNG